MSKTFVDIQGMYERFKEKRIKYLEENSPRAAFQMQVLMNWCQENGAKSE